MAHLPGAGSTGSGNSAWDIAILNFNPGLLFLLDEMGQLVVLFFGVFTSSSHPCADGNHGGAEPAPPPALPFPGFIPGSLRAGEMHAHKVLMPFTAGTRGRSVAALHAVMLLT